MQLIYRFLYPFLALIIIIATSSLPQPPTYVKHFMDLASAEKQHEQTQYRYADLDSIKGHLNLYTRIW